MNRLRTLRDPNHLPALDRGIVMDRPGAGMGDDQPPPRIFLLYGSLRERSFSRLAVEEAARLLILFGAEVRIFDPATYRCPIRWRATIILLCMSFVSTRFGPRAWSGAAPSGMADYRYNEGAD